MWADEGSRPTLTSPGTVSGFTIVLYCYICSKKMISFGTLASQLASYVRSKNCSMLYTVSHLNPVAESKAH